MKPTQSNSGGVELGQMFHFFGGPFRAYLVAELRIGQECQRTSI